MMSTSSKENTQEIFEDINAPALTGSLTLLDIDNIFTILFW